MEKLLDFLEPKTFSKIPYVVAVIWILIGVIFLGIFADIEYNEPRFDFNCAGAKSENIKAVQGECYEKYAKHYNKFGFPVYGFVITNFVLIISVCVIYSLIVRPTVSRLSLSIRDGDSEGQSRDQENALSTGYKLFIAYCCQLFTRLVLGVLFIILQTQLVYPLKFSSKFRCNLTDGTTQPRNSSDNTQHSTLHDCHNQRATKKTSWMDAVLVVNGILVVTIVVETVYLFSRACIERSFMQDSMFLKTHLSLNQHLNGRNETIPRTEGETEQLQERTHLSLNSHLDGRNETIPLTERHTEQLQERTYLSLSQHLDGRNETIPLTERHTEQLQERKFQDFIRRKKEIIIRETQGLLELQSPFLGNPGENTTVKHLTLDQIYTNLVVIPNRATYDFTENREEQLKIYPRSRGEKSQPKSLEGLLNVENKKVLIVGRAGIGKTLCCTKLVRDWALNKVFQATAGGKINFDAAFLVKFRRFKSANDLSLKELLIQSEYFPTDQLDDEVWNHLLENPKGVLILFDGFDEFKHDENVVGAPLYPRSNEEKKPLQILYQWLVTGKLLKDASIVTTTRPTALSSIKHLSFNKTYEVLGFSSEQVKEYVFKLAGDEKAVGETLWRHISSNLNLLSLCYVPVNSFIICTSLLEIQRKQESESSADVTLPSKLTLIYNIAVKVFYFKHTIQLCNILFPLEHDLPEDVLENFKILGKVAFDGIKDGKLILGGNEVQGMGDSALFHRLPDRKTDTLDREPQFCFIHLTMQEFFAARHLANNMSETELKNFVSENIMNGRWQLVFQFLAGLMENKTDLPSEIITDLLPVKTEEKESAAYNEQWTENEEKRKVTCWPTFDERELAVTLIKCLNENSRMNEEAQRKLQQMNFNCVNFIRCHLTAVDCSSLVNVINVQQISHLDLSENNIGPLGYFEICKLLKCRESQLSWLDLTRNQLTDEAAKYLADAINNNNCQLHTLILTANDISHIGAQYLAEAINNNNCQLHTLNLTNNDISHIGALLG